MLLKPTVSRKYSSGIAAGLVKFIAFHLHYLGFEGKLDNFVLDGADYHIPQVDKEVGYSSYKRKIGPSTKKFNKQYSY